MKKIAIIHGAAEGCWHSRILSDELKKAGFSVVSNPKNADGIIAHSGGCYLLPKQTYDFVLLIDPTYWPERSYTYRFFVKLHRDARSVGKDVTFWFWLNKLAHNVVYMITSPRHLTRMFFATQRRKLPVTSTKNCVIVRNRHDPWCAPDISERYEAHASFISLPGEHDDCWVNPDRYTSLVSAGFES